ncbi:MAG: ABC transporter permease [Clostridiales bacterium]|nr:ABC transporter permease [Clostridiales bacterium]
MFGTLFLKECRQTLKGLTYYILLAVLVLFFGTQMGNFEPLVKPVEGQENSYGMKASEDKQKIMSVTLAMLAMDFEANAYNAYPVGFYKRVTLNEAKKEKIHQILKECTGLEEGYADAIVSESITEEEAPLIIMGGRSGELAPAASLTYERFLELMGQADKIIGGGTNYNPEQVNTNATEPKTYEEALEEYEATIYTDRISGAYARLFCDYMGIILGLIPVFIAVTRSSRDRRAQADEVIYARKISSGAVILSRYLAIVVMIGIPVLLISLMPLLQCVYYGKTLGVAVDIFAFLKYFGGWLLPIIAVVTALGFFMTELTNGPAAILIQGVWWLVSIFMGSVNLVGSVGWGLIPRFNNFGETAVWQQVFPQMVVNRIFYSCFAIALVAGTIGIYHLKRKGVLGNGRKILGNRKRVS